MFLFKCAVCGAALEDNLEIQLVQNSAAWMLTGIARYNHVTPVLQEITLAISGFLNLIQSAGITFKALYGLGLGFLKDRFMIQVPVCSLHSFGESLLQILSSTQAQVVVTKKRALPSPWLPDSWHWKSLPMGV